jgi:hypothetical protein
MRSILLLSAALLVLGTVPGTARDYPVCSRIYGNGQSGTLRCDFANFRQCQATVSGQRGDCVRNPLMAYGRRYH